MVRPLRGKTIASKRLISNFPIEPHSATALFHWLPESVRLSMLMRRPRGHWGQAPDVDTAMRQIHGIILLDCPMLSPVS
jgi:hypothetical protein